MTDWHNAEIVERLATVLEPVHDELVGHLAPKDGERVLDLGVGTGAIALRAARLGADVTGIDASQAMIDTARERAAAEGLSLHLDHGRLEYLPYDDRSFDAVASAFGFVYEPDHANVAGELARIVGPGARIAFTAWKPNPKLSDLFRRFTEEPLEGREATEWGREDHVEDMLGEDFELEFIDGMLMVDAESGEEVWDLFSSTSPPVRALLAKLDADRARAFHAEFVELYETHREGDRVHMPRRYLLTLGTRR